MIPIQDLYLIILYKQPREFFMEIYGLPPVLFQNTAHNQCESDGDLYDLDVRIQTQAFPVLSRNDASERICWNTDQCASGGATCGQTCGCNTVGQCK